jgi:hypothetical protein
VAPGCHSFFLLRTWGLHSPGHCCGEQNVFAKVATAIMERKNQTRTHCIWKLHHEPPVQYYIQIKMFLKSGHRNDHCTVLYTNKNVFKKWSQKCL